MSNGARHVLGVVAGLLLPPIIAAGLWYGIGEYLLRFQSAFEPSWLGLSAIVASGIAFAFLAGSRLSPIASLLGGLAFGALGVLPIVELRGVRVLPDHWLPNVMEQGFRTVADSGVLLFLGVALVVVSLFPSRWRSSGKQAVYPSAYDPAPSYLPPYSGPEDTTRPMYRE
ncbi:hypothetical protein ACFPOI_49570 [Nonomuraea angiospora]|uniref:Uncharacterized protein n=1 Tax=Nonomuraea angiospora TaxID=46172 RepID=A0ABR9LWT7_9ACTN|nr:hypothetical protein [Nonomuraea angiospora]MBE1585110.1 hypothetical protein [Nonomuraea angiospora]